MVLQTTYCIGQGEAIEPINKGTILASEGKYEEAIKEYSYTIKAEPTNAEYYFRRGTLYLKLCNYDLALPDFNKTSQLKANYSDAYIYSAYIYALQQDGINALQKYDSMCKNNCRQEDIIKFRAKVFPSLWKGNFQKEVEFYTTIFRLFLKTWE